MKKLLIILLTVFAFNAHSQQEYSYSQYFLANSFFNPAATGTEKYAKAVTMFRKQWVDFNGSPTSFMALYDHPLDGQPIGVGGFIAHDKIGVTSMTTVNSNVSYGINLSTDKHLKFGLNMGADFLKRDDSQLEYWDQTDAVFGTGNTNFVIPRIGAGAWFYAKNMYVGISVPRIFNYNSAQFNSLNSGNLPSTVSNYYISSGYTKELSESMELDCYTLIKYTPKITPQADINFMLWNQDAFGFGVGYKTQAFVATMVQYKKDDIRFGYSFDFSVSAISKYSKGTHEISLIYNFVKEGAPASKM